MTKAIRTSFGSYFEIEPCSQKEVEDYIREVCIYFWNKAHDQNLDTEGMPPNELFRAIRNIINLREAKSKGNRIDEAVQLAQTFSKFEEFVEAVLKRASLSTRTETELLVNTEFETIDRERKWLHKNFENLNLCKISGFSLPKKIYVHLSPKILDLSKYPKFRSIIDTRGIDEEKDREDLYKYIRTQNNAICLFVEKFNDAPNNNTTELIKKYLTLESRAIDTKLALLVLPHKTEPENTPTSDGKVENKEEGIEVKTDEICKAFAKKKIHFIQQNILFYDALEYYQYHDRKWVLSSFYDQNDVVDDRNNILKIIKDMIERRENSLLEEVEKYAKLFENIKSSGGMNEREEKLIDDLKKTIENHKNSKFLSDFENKYKSNLRSYHPSTFRAINNRRGRYGLRNIDIYFDASSVFEKVLRNKLLESKDKIVGAIELLEEFSSNNSGLRPIIQMLKEEVNNHFSKITIEIGQEVKERTEEHLEPLCDNEFWDYLRQRWGGGPGYVNDAIGRYNQKIYGIDPWLTGRVQELWEQNFVNKILEFFGEE